MRLGVAIIDVREEIRQLAASDQLIDECVNGAVRYD